MSGDHNQYQKDKSYLDFECPRCEHCCQAKGEEHMSKERVDETAKNRLDREHLQAAAYANERKDAYLDLMKKGAVEKLNRKMINWLWVAHYEGYRDAVQEKNHG